MKFTDFFKTTVGAVLVLRCFYPDITGVNRVIFEYAPNENYTNDHSAFDIAFEVLRENELGLIGFECKFTDTFSTKEYNKELYREIFRQSDIFSTEYEAYVAGRYNQLFRNQLIAEALLNHQKYDFVYTGLFCHQEDKPAIDVGNEFHAMLKSDKLFRVITYQEYIEKVQQLPLDWAQRELLMILWARHCTTQFSEICIE